MGHSDANGGKNGSSQKSTRGIIGSCIYFVWLILLMSLFAWFFMVLELSVYQFAQGKDKTQQKIHSIIDSNITRLSNKNYFLVDDTHKALEWTKKHLLYADFTTPDTLNGLAWAKQHMQHAGAVIEERTPQVKDKAMHVWDHIIYPLLTLFLGAAAIVGMRVFIFLLSLPLFLLCVCLGCVDGLVQRDIRKFQAARESTYFFHRIKKMWKTCFFAPLLLYLVWPYAIHFIWCIAPMAVFLATTMQVSLRSFKKYV
jgi:integrating conjugative element membrane protein (TIGR03747 family)